MSEEATYEVVEHDGGWAYRMNGTLSETFRAHGLALQAARRAAQEQRVPGETTAISFEDEMGVERDETDAGDDRPKTRVIDEP